jgi:beta-N-acetylhexosaminidase
MRFKFFGANQFLAWKRSGRFLHFIILTTFIASLLGPVPAARAQTPTPPTKVLAVLASMTPQERVGQLFLVTFRGTETGAESQIYDLIVNHHVGGAVLLAENENFAGEPETISRAHQLIGALQALEWEATVSLSPSSDRNTYVPLFLGISQDGNGAPYDQILSGLTPLPDAMAIGATWRTDLAQQVGDVLGSELSALGFNLYFGPSLDVVESPNPSARSDLGTRVFGGDPFWVGEMGRAFVAGLHSGSNNKMMVIAKHFPGRGSSDRSPEEEVATVRTSLEQLKQIDLPPFFAVTNSTDASNVVDGLLVSHIRYQGFQGNIRATTRPVSLDSPALSAIISLPEFAAWRANNGLLVSDALGSDAVRAFYSQSGENFTPRAVARDAFLAGNDLLYLGNIVSDEAESSPYSAALDILDFFAQEYERDPTFAARVDAAVTRILVQKFRMYDVFTQSNVLAPDFDLETIGSSGQVMFEVASNAATLVSPGVQELSALLPAPPNQNDRIVFLTDTSMYQQCSSCPSQNAFTADTLQNAVVRLYGQGGSAQIFTNRLNSFPFSELELMLNAESETNIEPSLERATWVVISLADVGDGRISLLRRFFAERPNLIRNKNVILFSFTAPYYFDATDISKLTAYYALYSKQPVFVDVAARLLFQQLSTQGSSPVSIPSVGYDLIQATSPNEAQIISLAIERAEIPATPIAETLTAEPTEIPLYQIGDTISVRGGPILDRNNHLVPDGTVAIFTMSTRADTGEILRQEEATTVAGIARASFVIDKPGQVEIRVVSEPAVTSEVLQFDASDIGVAVTVVVPATLATSEPVLPTPTVMPRNDLVSPEGYPRIGAWMLVLLALTGGAALAFWAVSRLTSPRWGVRFALCVILGGLLSYNYLVLGFPGAATWIAADGSALRILLLTFVGEVLGLVAALVWMNRVSARELQED